MEAHEVVLVIASGWLSITATLVVCWRLDGGPFENFREFLKVSVRCSAWPIGLLAILCVAFAVIVIGALKGAQKATESL